MNLFPDEDDADRTAGLLRGALNREADRIEPGHDGLRLIRERIAAGEHPATGPVTRFLPLLAAAAAVLVAAGASFGIIALQQRPATPGGQGMTAARTTSPAPASTAPLPVYWVGEADSDLWLYREFDPDPAGATTAAGRVEAAVRRMLAGPPADPDYRTPWRPAPVHASVGRSQITVDLGAAAFANPSVGSRLAERAVQQLVYTATAAAGSTEPPRTVRVLVDGRSGVDAWGAVTLGRAQSRSSLVLPEVWVIDPDQDSIQDAGTVTVRGTGRGFEGTLRWQVTDGTGAIVATGTVQAGSGQIAEFSFGVDLQPGHYTVAVWSPSPKDGTDSRPFEDTKRFTVR